MSGRWRARIEADLDHAASAGGTEVDAMAGQDGIAFAIVSRFDRRRWCRRLESGADERELGGPAGVRQESEVTDAAEALGQNVEQKATDELIGFERHHLGLVVVTIVLPTEADMAILAGEQPAVGDRDPMGVPQPSVHRDHPCEGDRSLGSPSAGLSRSLNRSSKI